MPQSLNERITAIERIVDTHAYRLNISMKEFDASSNALR